LVKGFSFAQLGATDAQGSGRQLQLGHSRALVGLGERSQADAVAPGSLLHALDVVHRGGEIENGGRSRDGRSRTRLTDGLEGQADVRQVGSPAELRGASIDT
jgi:hypothetical protein